MVIYAITKIWGPEYSCIDVRYLLKSSVEIPYVTAGDVIAPCPPTELGVGGGDC